MAEIPQEDLKALAATLAKISKEIEKPPVSPPKWIDTVKELPELLMILAFIEYPAKLWVWLWRKSAGVRTIVEFAGAIIITLGVYGLYLEREDRKEDRATRNAQLIAQIESLAGNVKSANYSPGIMTVMELLAKEGISMSGLSVQLVTLEGANLRGAHLNSAKLSGANLSGALLIEADLTEADLKQANLRGTELSGADLTGADLSGTDLKQANLRGTDLSGADLTGADLSETDLSGATLHNATLIDANLSNAVLIGTNLSGAYLNKAKLGGANLSDANLYRAKLNGAKRLTQGQLDNACLSDLEHPPFDLPKEVTTNKDLTADNMTICGPGTRK